MDKIFALLMIVNISAGVDIVVLCGTGFQDQDPASWTGIDSGALGNLGQTTDFFLLFFFFFKLFPFIKSNVETFPSGFSTNTS